jgi:hypothetical protein
MEQHSLADAIDSAMCKLRAIPSPSEESPMAVPLVESLSDLSSVLALAESGGSMLALERAKKRARTSLTMLILTAEKSAFAKVDELKTALADADSALTNW